MALEGPAEVRARVEALRSAAESAAPAARAAILLTLGNALFDAGDFTAATGAFRTARAEGNGAIAERARWRLADALHAQGLAAEAIAAWRPLVQGALAENLEPQTRLAYARDLHETGDRRRAAAILRDLWTSLPEREEATDAEAELARWRERGEPVPPFAADERLARAHRLVAVGRAEAARAELDAAERTEPTARPELIALARAATLLATGRTAEAAAAVSSYADSRDPGVRRGVNLLLARAAARERRFTDAIAWWRAVAESPAPVPGLPPGAQATLRDDAEFLSAWLHLDAGDPDRAAEALSRLARERPGSRRADDARWFAAWALVRKGDTAGADAALRPLESGPTAMRARYWRARITAAPELRLELLRGAVQADPVGYYGLLACARLRSSGVACALPPLAPGPPLPDLESLPDAPRLRQAAALAAVGLRDEAVQELTALTRSNGGRRGAPLAAELAAFLGDPLLPFRVARDQLGLSRRSLAWAYPAAWPTLVGPAARSAGVDPSLLRAVMRRESSFRTDVRSAAGAVGLLQIVPGTSERLSSLLALPQPATGRLDEPSVNVPLGAAYLSLLLERFGEPLVAIAAYNAGPNAVLRWSRDREGLPLDTWVESIPFRETRDYVRAVVENWAWTRAAAGEPPPPLDPDRRVAPPSQGIGF